MNTVIKTPAWHARVGDQIIHDNGNRRPCTITRIMPRGRRLRIEADGGFFPCYVDKHDLVSLIRSNSV